MRLDVTHLNRHAEIAAVFNFWNVELNPYFHDAQLIDELELLTLQHFHALDNPLRARMPKKNNNQENTRIKNMKIRPLMPTHSTRLRNNWKENATQADILHCMVRRR
jgi:hypothetical protein